MGPEESRTRTQQELEGARYFSNSPAYVLPLAIFLQAGISFLFPFIAVAMFVPAGWRWVILPWLFGVLAIEELRPGAIQIWSLFLAALVTPNHPSS